MKSTRTVTVFIAAVVVIAAAAWYLLRPPYGPIGQQAYRYSTALYSAANQQDDARLATIETMLHADAQRGLVATDAAGWMQSIIDAGRQGDWTEAQQDARDLLEAQVQR